MLTADEALQKVLSHCEPLRAERVTIDQAVGRALASTVSAKRTLPPWDNSAMDGYAVRAVEAAAGKKLRLGEKIFAGQKATRALLAGEAARIMTGAPLPPGADAVVMQEKTRAEGEQIEILEAPSPGLNVRREGEDSRAGESLLSAGTAVGIIEAGLLWAQGETHAEVRARPRVSILSTGDELVPVGHATGDRIVDTNSPAVAWAVERAGGIATPLGIAVDDLSSVRQKIEQGLEADVLITNAGVSVGDKDFVKAALESLGVELVFWRIAIRPGKPLVFGRRGKTLVFGLPGNPLSSMVCFELFVRPALRALLGLRAAPAPRMPGRITGAYKKAAGLAHYVRATVEPGTLDATPLPTQTSGALRSGSQATHLIELQLEQERWNAGDSVQLIPLTWGI